MAKRIYVDLEQEDYDNLVRLAKKEWGGASPAQVLKAFAQDLTLSKHSQGSDERMFAVQWFDRSADNWYWG